MLPLPSVTVHVTVVVPIGKVAGASLIAEATEQLSAVVGVPKDNPDAVHVPASTFTETADGAVIVGLILSTTVTTCVAVAVLPLPSVTVHVTVVVPNGKVAGASLVTEATEQLSLVTGVPKFAIVTSHPAVMFAVSAEGATIIGFCESLITTS